MTAARARTADVVVVGGGAVGCGCAFALAREGLRVALLERDDLAAGASGAAAGMLLPAGEARTPGPLLSWGLRSLALFPELTAELRERTGIDPEYEPSGALTVATDDAGADDLRARPAALPDLELAWLDAAEARGIEPRLAPAVRGALWSPREGHVRSPLFTRALAAAAAQLGATLETGCEVTGLVRDGGRVRGVRTRAGEWHAGHVVLAAGAWSAGFAREAGQQPLPVEPVRGQIVALEGPSPALGAILLSGPTYLVPKRDGSVIVGATEERVGFALRVTAAGVATLLDAAVRLVPDLAEAPFRSAWAGLRPGSPDHLPLLGPHPEAPGLLLAAGHHRNGVLLAPVTAQLVADWILGKGLPPDASAFRPTRFA